MTRELRVLLTDRAWPDVELEREILDDAGAELIDAPGSDEATLLELAPEVDAIGTCWANVTSRVIRAASRCRVVSRFGIGLDNIAVETATERGIPVTFVPDYCLPDVSDHALGLLLACARQIGFFHHRTKRGEYNLRAAPPIHRLAGRVLGLVGFGRIGRAVFPKARALGLEVIASTPSGNAYGTGCQMVSFDELLERSDFVSVHAPSTEETRGLFGAEEFRRMKRSAYLINTSRGALVDETALWEALQQDEIAGAALDVFDPEPPDLSRPLFRDERVIVTPHAGFWSEESLGELRTRASRQMREALQGRRPEHVVNPQVYDNR